MRSLVFALLLVSSLAIVAAPASACGEPEGCPPPPAHPVVPDVADCVGAGWKELVLCVT